MKPEKLREMVAESYAAALRRSRRGAAGCCAPDEGGGDTAGGACRPAGYGAEFERHAEAASSSFGCGNPLAFAGVREGETVLDLGSGGGLDLLVAAERVGPAGRVIGVDMTDAMIAEACANAARAGADHVELRKGLIEELPVESDSVDWVISNCVINLSPEKPRVFAEIHRVLRPGGRFSISDIVAEDLPREVLEHAAAYAACVAGAIPEREYVAGLEQAGLIDVEVGERLVYRADQVEAIVASDLGAVGMPPDEAARLLRRIEGRVASVRVTGRKPPVPER